MHIHSDHIRSLLFGIAVGDALGVPVEFKSREYLKENPVTDMIGYGTHNQPPGTWSDDTSMSLCLAESLSLPSFDLQNLSNRFINWAFYGYWTPHGEVFDIGGTTLSAIQRLNLGELPENAGGALETDNGNGGLMRILPLTFKIINLPILEAFELTKKVTSLTHAHIRSTLSGFYLLDLAKNLLNGNSPRDSYFLTNKTISQLLEELKLPNQETAHFESLLSDGIYNKPEHLIRSSGYVIHSLEASVWCLLKSNGYKEAVLKAVSLGEDTDTIGAITGGLAGLCFGHDAIPQEWINILARTTDIENLSIKLFKSECWKNC